MLRFEKKDKKRLKISSRRDFKRLFIADANWAPKYRDPLNPGKALTGNRFSLVLGNSSVCSVRSVAVSVYFPIAEHSQLCAPFPVDCAANYARRNRIQPVRGVHIGDVCA